MPAIRDWLTRTFAGRALLAGALLKLAGRLSGVIQLESFGNVALTAAAVVLAWRLFVILRTPLLWRVRRRLTLSYIFIGVVPALLIVLFFLLCGVLVLLNVSAYVMQSRMQALVEDGRFLAQAAALELQAAATPGDGAAVLARRQAAAASRYPGASYALVPVARRCAEAGGARAVTPAAVAAATAGAWSHLDAPNVIPAWIGCEGYAGLLAYVEPLESGARRVRVTVRAVALPDDPAPRYAVLVDVPVTAALADRLREDTGVDLGDVTLLPARSTHAPPLGRRIPGDPGPRPSDTPPTNPFEQSLGWVSFFEYRDWQTGEAGALTTGIFTTAERIYERVVATPVTPIRSLSFGQMLLLLLGVVLALFLVIQVAALAMGLALARSITGSVHELFVGTERVRQGDFTHKIPIRTRDQLGELAESFNSMTASIEDLLQQKAEKERLEQELRIARSIQMSLLPQGPLRTPRLSLTGHCEPAREVGGDYYDFIPLEDERVGLLIADVAGKGTSAALYMAELKGIILSLSERHRSPRELLIAANRILSRHLHSGSFITIIYGVADLRAGTLTYARAGHCPPVYVPGPYAAVQGAQVLASEGLVLGLDLDGGRLFASLLEEKTLPLAPGDLVLLYTDGITEATSPGGDFFGEPRLGALVERHARLPAEELRERILREVGAFVGGAPQQDDMTMLLLKVEATAAVH